MSWILIICGLVGAYSMLNLMGGERQRRLIELEARAQTEALAAAAAAKSGLSIPPVNPPAQAADKSVR